MASERQDFTQIRAYVSPRARGDKPLTISKAGNKIILRPLFIQSSFAKVWLARNFLAGQSSATLVGEQTFIEVSIGWRELCELCKRLAKLSKRWLDQIFQFSKNILGLPSHDFIFIIGSPGYVYATAHCLIIEPFRTYLFVPLKYETINLVNLFLIFARKSGENSRSQDSKIIFCLSEEYSCKTIRGNPCCYVLAGFAWQSRASLRNMTTSWNRSTRSSKTLRRERHIWVFAREACVSSKSWWRILYWYISYSHFLGCSLNLTYSLESIIHSSSASALFVAWIIFFLSRERTQKCFPRYWKILICAENIFLS